RAALRVERRDLPLLVAGDHAPRHRVAAEHVAAGGAHPRDRPLAGVEAHDEPVVGAVKAPVLQREYAVRGGARVQADLLARAGAGRLRLRGRALKDRISGDLVERQLEVARTILRPEADLVVEADDPELAEEKAAPLGPRVAHLVAQDHAPDLVA